MEIYKSSDFFNLERYGYLFPIVLFIIIYSWNPFFLGIYSDDYGYILGWQSIITNKTPFAYERLLFYMNEFANRPLIGILYFTASSICNNSIVTWHVMLNLLFLANLIALWYFFKNLLIFLNFTSSKLLSNLSISFIIASPWIHGYTLWISSAMNSISILFFALSGALLFKSWTGEKKYYYLSILFYFLSIISYESFYLQFIVLLAVGWFSKVLKNISKSALWKPALGFIIVQTIAIFWNRYSTTFVSKSVHKISNPYIMETFAANILSFPYSLVMSFYENIWLILPLLVFIITIFIIILNRHKDNSNDKSNILILIVLSLFGILIALFIYSITAYSVWSMGARGRTMMVPGIWLAIIFTLIISYLMNHSGKLKKITIWLIVLLFIFFSFSSIIRTMDWANSWTMQQKVIKSLPAEKINKTAIDAVILFDGPFRYNWVPVFDAQWAINYQMNESYKIINKHALRLDSPRKFVVGRGIKHQLFDTPWISYWNGEKLFQDFKTKDSEKKVSKLKGYMLSPNTVIRGSELWVWDYHGNKFYQVKEPKEIILRQYNNYDHWLTEIWLKIKN